MNNRNAWILLAAVVLGVFLVMAVQAFDEPNNPSIGEQMGEAVEEVGDEIEDSAR